MKCTWIQSAYFVIKYYFLLQVSAHLRHRQGEPSKRENMQMQFTFMWPCIVTNPYNKTNLRHLFLKFILEWDSTCFGQFLCPSSRVLHCTHSNGICHSVLLTAFEQDQDGTPWSWSQAVRKPVWHIPLLCVQWKTPEDGQRNYPTHVEFHSKINLRI